MDRPTRGHELFEAWLITEFGASTRSRHPGERPRFESLRETRQAIRRELKAIGQEAAASLAASVGDGIVLTALRPPKSPLGLYHWLASAKPTARRTPPPHIRLALERVTGGAVPVAAWEQLAAA